MGQDLRIHRLFVQTGLLFKTMHQFPMIFFWVSYDHWADELNGFNRIFMTIQQGYFRASTVGDLYYTPATTLYLPELCSPYPGGGGGGGCLSGVTTSGEIFKEIDSSNICSQCNPTQQELDACWQTGGTYDWSSCQCGQSPIVIDVLGNNFNLTNASTGIQFDINGDGTMEQISWSSTNSDDAWLVLDRNNNGLIDNGTELFGNATPQPVPPIGKQKNGFLALAVFDKNMNGGNNDENITNQDNVFNRLRLWQDINHNGISESGELKTLQQLGLAKIELDYKESRRTDEHGNRFKYRAKIKDAQGAQIGRWAWDVFLVTEPIGN